MPAFATMAVVSNDTRNMQFDVVAARLGTTAVPFHVVYPLNRYLSRRVRIFRAWLVGMFSEPGQRD